MSTEKLESYVEYCKNHAISELEDMKGFNRSIYFCDSGYELTSAINCDGSATCNTWLAKEYIKEWYDEAGDVYDYHKDNYS